MHTDSPAELAALPFDLDTADRASAAAIRAGIEAHKAAENERARAAAKREQAKKDTSSEWALQS